MIGHALLFAAGTFLPMLGVIVLPLVAKSVGVQLRNGFAGLQQRAAIGAMGVTGIAGSILRSGQLTAKLGVAGVGQAVGLTVSGLTNRADRLILTVGRAAQMIGHALLLAAGAFLPVLGVIVFPLLAKSVGVRAGLCYL